MLNEQDLLLSYVDIPGRKAKMKVVQMNYLIENAMQAYWHGDMQEMIRCLDQARGWKNQTEAATPIFMHSFENKETLPAYLQDKLDFVMHPKEIKPFSKYEKQDN